MFVLNTWLKNCIHKYTKKDEYKPRSIFDYSRKTKKVMKATMLTRTSEHETLC